MNTGMEKQQAKIVLEEGKYYPFRISGSVVLPDGAECFVLTDVNGVKHLLYKSHYLYYGLELNSEVRCRIDKINCTGKIFIEPEHPFYKLGVAYDFVFDRFLEQDNGYGVAERLAVLRNGHAQDIYMPADEIDRPLTPGEMLRAMVERIKKGRVYLSMGGSVNDYTGLEAGKRYHFRLDHIRNEGGRYATYVLLADNGREFRIRKKFYEKYGFKNGDLITCELVETDHQVFLEPVHPYFEVGFNYEFNILGETLVDEYPSGKAAALRLENRFGKDILVRRQDVDPRRIHGNTLKCAVTAIKKSQVFLACS